MLKTCNFMKNEILHKHCQRFWQKMQNSYSAAQPFICTFNKAENIEKKRWCAWDPELLQKKKLSQTDSFTVFSLLCESMDVCKIFQNISSTNDDTFKIFQIWSSTKF